FSRYKGKLKPSRLKLKGFSFIKVERFTLSKLNRTTQYGIDALSIFRYSLAPATINGRLRFLIILRKEVIQPHLPIRLPCYDFTPIIGPTFGGWFHKWLPHRLRVLLTLVVCRTVCTSHGNVFTAAFRSAITSDSCFMQANCSLHSELRMVLWDSLMRRRFAALCSIHCSTCVAQVTRGMMI